MNDVVRKPVIDMKDKVELTMEKTKRQNKIIPTVPWNDPEAIAMLSKIYPEFLKPERPGTLLQWSVHRNTLEPNQAMDYPLKDTWRRENSLVALSAKADSRMSGKTKEMHRKEMQRIVMQWMEMQRKETQRQEMQWKEMQREEMQREEMQRMEMQRQEIHAKYKLTEETDKVKAAKQLQDVATLKELLTERIIKLIKSKENVNMQNKSLENVKFILWRVVDIMNDIELIRNVANMNPPDPAKNVLLESCPVLGIGTLSSLLIPFAKTKPGDIEREANKSDMKPMEFPEQFDLVAKYVLNNTDICPVHDEIKSLKKKLKIPELPSHTISGIEPMSESTLASEFGDGNMKNIDTKAEMAKKLDLPTTRRLQTPEAKVPINSDEITLVKERIHPNHYYTSTDTSWLYSNIGILNCKGFKNITKLFWWMLTQCNT